MILVELALVVEQQMAARQLNRVARDLGRDKGIAVAVAADPRAEAQHLRQLVRLDLETVGSAQRLGDLAIKPGQRVKDGNVVVVEAHLDFVVDGGPARAHFVGLPQAGDLGEHQLFEARDILLGDGNAIERGKKFADAAALEHHGAARHLSGVRGEHGHDEHAAQPVQRLVGADADAAHLARACRRASRAGGRPRRSGAGRCGAACDGWFRPD